MSNESIKQHIKEFLLTSFVFEMTDTYNSLRLSKFVVFSLFNVAEETISE